MNQTVLDVVIIGSGISGIGAAYNLQKHRPKDKYVILESRGDLGGTWDLFRYPGIRSDSDLFTFSYDFKPWVSDKAIADGAAIKDYIAETARENGIRQHIRFHHKVLGINWSSSERLWTIHIDKLDTGERITMKAKWIFSGTGYYRYDEGFTPKFEGRERFQGQVIHPQHWPDDLDWTGKRIVVIGSGATAVTLVPSLSPKAAHVTMLQRTPTYILPVPSKDPIASRLRPLVGDRITHAVARWFNVSKQRWFYTIAQRYPNWTRNFIRKMNVRMLPEGYSVDVHFNPPYAPWDQRLCAVPSADLFREIKAGRATIVTDKITTFTETGIQLQSGQHLDADIIITATGLNLLPFGGIQMSVDDKAVEMGQSVAFKGMMMSNVPNYVFAIGYTSSSWTLKIGLVCEHFIRLLSHMDKHDLEVCTPVADPNMETLPLLNFGAGYVQRSLSALPLQGKTFPWAMSWNYFSDAKMFRKGAVTDKSLHFKPKSKSKPTH